MNPTRLWARNLRTWEGLDVEIPTGATAIVGENGAGKSTLVQVLRYALFGGARGELGRQLTRGSSATEVEVGCEYTHGDLHYRVRRVAGPKPRLDYDRATGPGEWEPLARETIAETQAAICADLGCTEEVFCASAYLAQGDGAAFTEAAPRERKRILMEVLDPSGLWPRLHERARAEHREAQVAARAGAALVESLAGAEEAAAAAYAMHAAAVAEDEQARMEVDDATRGHEAVARTLSQAEDALAARRRVAAEVQELEEQYGGLRGRRSVLAGRIATIEERLAHRAEFQAAEKLLPRLEEAERDLRLVAGLSGDTVDAEQKAAKYEALVDTYVSAVAGAAERLEQHMGESPVCPTCQQEVKGAAHERVLEHLRDAVRTAEEARDEALLAAQQARAEAAKRQEEHDAVLARVPEEWRGGVGQLLSDARSAALHLAGLAEAAEHLEQARLELGEHEVLLTRNREALERAQGELQGLPAGDLEPARAALHRAAAALSQARRRAAAAAEELGRCAERATQARTQEAAYEAAKAAQGPLDRLLVLWGHLERAYSPNGIPALILENAAVPHLEAEANRLISEFGRAYRYELRTQRAAKTTDSILEVLDIVIHTPQGEALYEDFSGGERTRLDLALRIALARLLASRRGANIEVLVIDEPSYLDEAGFARLAHVLQELRGEFQRVLVVSHVPALRDAFDQAIAIEGGADTGEPSRVAP